ncbi:hypothetical protein BOTNAR_0384g00040 [Botryotinia narcissicola]|uniref:Uncharacterized protein n=1 Tax=Botryotinia narcissicola TaxID=278944 RepID=A0A4Z1HVX7_9HELO|nr:hypothetical protein BOTNAR_0384g00040 [Botryotinia narcissicola]
MVDIELTNVETRSHLSQPSVQNASIKEESSSDPTGKHPESSVPAHIVEATLEDKDEDLIMLPAAKLEEWLKQGIQILRENRQRTKAAGSNTEYEALENEPGNPEIGGLRLIWKDVLEEHLLLDPETRRLFVTFFGSIEEFTKSFINLGKSSQYQSIDTPIWNAFDPTSDSETNGPSIFDGVHKTWDLLNSASQDHRKLYRSIVECSFLDLYHDIPSYKITFALRDESELPYAHFGPLEHRVRILREYMDKQKPRGLRQLWMDSKDSFNYYTFRGVIIFGAVSVFLATASLAVSIAQTYASFKSLGQLM